MTLYLKYRPQNLEELDITSVRESLKKIVEQGNIPHAFLFSGPKGTGKTSTARILAKAINCQRLASSVQGIVEPCNKCEQCISITNGSNLDVIEIDAASNRGIDDIRILREGVKLAPTSAKKKIYIIDEAHMLTTEASNALLKTLEEPPEHVVFIFATTNPEKLIETIHSRVTKVNFTKATGEEIRRSLERVIKGEKVKISEDDLIKIADLSDGSFRDAVKNLESYLANGNKLPDNNVFDIDKFINNLYEKNQDELLDTISDLAKNGASFESFINRLLDKLRIDLLADTTKTEIIEVIELFMVALEKMKFSPIEELPLEIAIIKYTKKSNQESGIRNQEEIKTKQKIKNIDADNDKWKMILDKVKPINASIEALLRSSQLLEFDGRVLKLGVYYKFHKERLEENKNKRVLESVIEELFGSSVKISCLLTDPPVASRSTDAISLTENNDQDIIKVAQQIFSN